MSATPSLSPQVIGQTEKALNAILERLLAGTGLTEPQWVALTLTVMSGGAVDHDQLIGRVAGVLKVSEAQAQARIAELAGAQLVQVPEDERALVSLTDATAGGVSDAWEPHRGPPSIPHPSLELDPTGPHGAGLCLEAPPGLTLSPSRGGQG